MISVIEIVYPYNLTCECIKCAEALRACGIYVYETSMENLNWINKSKKNRIENRLYFMNNEQQILNFKDSAYEKNKFILFSDEVNDFYLKEKQELRDTQLSTIIQEIDVQNNCEGFLVWFFDYIRKEKLFFIFFAIKNHCIVHSLMEEAEKKLKNMLQELKVHDKKWDCAVYYFSYAYLCNLVNHLAELCEREKEYDFKEIMYYCNEAYNREPNLLGINELKGDVYFSFANNYVLGTMYYKECLNQYNYTAPYKLSEYWSNIVEDWTNEEKYLLATLECNEEKYDAIYRLGWHLESNFEKEEALNRYFDITKMLSVKEEHNFLRPEEFQYLCMAHKRIGCIIYKDEANPNYYAAIREYKKIMILWNNCESNKFIQCIPEKYRGDMVKYYKSLFGIRKLLLSLANIYNLVDEKEKREKCISLCRDASGEELDILPLDVI